MTNRLKFCGEKSGDANDPDIFVSVKEGSEVGRGIELMQAESDHKSLSSREKKVSRKKAILEAGRWSHGVWKWKGSD